MPVRGRRKAFVPASWYAYQNKLIKRYIDAYGNEPAVVPGRGKHRG